VLTQRKHFVGRNFAVRWLGFLIVAAGTFTFSWAYVSLIGGRILGPRPFIFEAALTVACYPVGSYVLARLHRAFVQG
jgi:rod shape-determining protein MreD